MSRPWCAVSDVIATSPRRAWTLLSHNVLRASLCSDIDEIAQLDSAFIAPGTTWTEHRKLRSRRRIAHRIHIIDCGDEEFITAQTQHRGDPVTIHLTLEGVDDRHTRITVTCTPNLHTKSWLSKAHWALSFHRKARVARSIRKDLADLTLCAEYGTSEAARHARYAYAVAHPELHTDLADDATSPVPLAAAAPDPAELVRGTPPAARQPAADEPWLAALEDETTAASPTTHGGFAAAAHHQQLADAHTVPMRTVPGRVTNNLPDPTVADTATIDLTGPQPFIASHQPNSLGQPGAAMGITTTPPPGQNASAHPPEAQVQNHVQHPAPVRSRPRRRN